MSEGGLELMRIAGIGSRLRVTSRPLSVCGIICFQVWSNGPNAANVTECDQNDLKWCWIEARELTSEKVKGVHAAQQCSAYDSTYY